MKKIFYFLLFFSTSLLFAKEDFISIPDKINGVKIEFAKNVNRKVHPDIVEALKFCIKKKYGEHELESIWISSANDSHKWPSRHVMGKAVDISRINGKKMSVYYKKDKLVKHITNAIQNNFESFNGRRENFGPHFCKKLGKKYDPKGDHSHHIHLSVN